MVKTLSFCSQGYHLLNSNAMHFVNGCAVVGWLVTGRNGLGIRLLLGIVVEVVCGQELQRLPL